MKLAIEVDGEHRLRGRGPRMSARAFTATRMLDPDIEIAAISGRSVRPHFENTPAEPPQDPCGGSASGIDALGPLTVDV